MKLSWLLFIFLSLLCSTSCLSIGIPFIQQSNEEQIEETSSQALSQPIDTLVVDSFFQTPTTITSSQHNVDTKSVISEKLQTHIYNLSNDESLRTFLTTIRRTLHQHPELMYQESYTSDTIQKILDSLDISYSIGWSKNTHPDRYAGSGGFGIVATIGTGSGPCVLLRADMDALPIDENVETKYKSQTRNKMHACGHDGHVTMLLGAAKILKQMENSIPGTIRLVFQPAEEGGAGAKRMIEEGVLEMEPKPSVAFAMHVWPTLPTGTIASRPGPLLAAAEHFEIVVAGKGGHAAMPHLNVDPVVCASYLVVNLQTIVSRVISPLEAGVISVTMFSAGDAYNVIPASAILRGTIRALSTEKLLWMRDKLEHLVHTTSSMHGCNSTIQYSPDFYPPTINDEILFQSFSKDVGALVSHSKTVQDVEPTMGGEDFAFFAQEIPSTFFLLGQSGHDDTDAMKEQYAHHMPRTDYGLHHPNFALDENVLPIGVELHVNLALRAIKELQSGRIFHIEAIEDEL
jgi:IAA-amino acid hydrolase